MTRAFRCRTGLGAGAAVAVLSLVGGTAAHAAAPPRGAATSGGSPAAAAAAPAAGSFSLTVSPTRLEVTGAALHAPQQVQVRNNGTAALQVTAKPHSFGASTDGAMDLTDAAVADSAASWVTLSPAAFTLLPGQTQTVTAAIDVPAQPEPGDHQVALVFLVPAGHTGGNIAINRGIAVPAYLTVAGPQDNAATITSLTAPSFSAGGRITLRAQVQSTGTVHRDFRGPQALAITGTGGPATFPSFTLVRGATRDISTTWKPPLACICHPTVTIVNADGTVVTKRIRVIVFPVVPVAIGLGGIVVFGLGLRWRRRRFDARVHAVATRLAEAGAA